jgi:multidrug resistance efflux pump
MNIEQKLAYLRKVLEMGADVQVTFHNARTQEEAKSISSALNELFPQDFNKMADPNSSLRWLKAQQSTEISHFNWVNLNTTIFYDEVKEEELA